MRRWVGASMSLALLVACSEDPAAETAPPEPSSRSASPSIASPTKSVDLTADAVRDAVEAALSASSIELYEEVPAPRSLEYDFGTSQRDPDWLADGFPEGGVPGWMHSTFAMPTKQRNANVYVNLFVVDHPPESEPCEIPWEGVDRSGVVACEVTSKRGRTVVIYSYRNVLEYYVLMPGFVVNTNAVTATMEGSPTTGPLPMSRLAVGDLAHRVVDELVE